MSDAVGPERLRLLRAESGDALDWLRETGPLFSPVFPPRVTLLWRGESEWGFTVWEGEAEAESGGGTLATARRRAPWDLLPGARRPPAAEEVWARERGLPLDRLRAPILDYVTVAQLDQRSLLVENGPRLYRFPLGSDA